MELNGLLFSTSKYKYKYNITFNSTSKLKAPKHNTNAS